MFTGGWWVQSKTDSTGEIEDDFFPFSVVQLDDYFSTEPLNINQETNLNQTKTRRETEIIFTRWRQLRATHNF